MSCLAGEALTTLHGYLHQQVSPVVKGPGMKCQLNPSVNFTSARIASSSQRFWDLIVQKYTPKQQINHF